MKIILALGFASFLLMASACKGTKYCPTYSQNPEKEVVNLQEYERV